MAESSLKKTVELTGEVAFDEVYVVAGHKGQPAKVAAPKRRGRSGDVVQRKMKNRPFWA